LRELGKSVRPVPDIEQQCIVGWRSGAARPADLATQISALQRMHVLYQRHATEDDEAQHEPLRRDPAGNRAPWLQYYSIEHIETRMRRADRPSAIPRTA